jgi:hypothetical protein
MPSVYTTRGFATRASAGNTAVIAAPGTGKELIVKNIAVTIHTFASSGKVILDDGTTERFAWDATTAGGGQPPQLVFPEGCKWGVNKAVRLVTEGAIEVFVYVAAEQLA